ncbi:MAG: division/cell wall cluster transcriptional repressor MraZ [Bacteroidaceae bacterium]|nr:division/cell wall cluster transcriptional repressor MraZ [Bacteroidaceae bacterium]
MRFIGDYSAKADAKGRVFLPAPLRKVLEGAGESRCILRVDLFQPCLVLYPESLWHEMLDMLRSRLNRWNGTHQQLLRKFLADAEVVELDSNGRILINKRKLDYAGITADVRFLAVDDHIEIWDKQRCEQVLNEQSTLGEDLQAIMADMPTAITQNI